MGRWDLRSVAFKEEINELCESDYLGEASKRRVPESIARLIDPLVDGLIGHAIKPGLHEWRDDRIRTLAKLEPRVAALAREWLGSADAQRQIQAQCVSWLDDIQTDLAEEIDRICQEFGIPAGVLKLDVIADLSQASPDKFSVNVDPAELLEGLERPIDETLPTACRRACYKAIS